MRNSPALRRSTLVRRTSVLAAGALASLVLAACGDDDSPVAQDPAAAEPSSSAPTTSAPATASVTPTPTPATTPTTAPSSPAGEASASPAGEDVLITLDSPAAGATVSGSFRAAGTANSPEANVPWRLLDASGKKVAEGYFTAEGWMDKRYPYAGTVDVSKVAPGGYTFEVAVDDPSGGEGGQPQKVHRAITVQ
jgi:hypothetical protein